MPPKAGDPVVSQRAEQTEYDVLVETQQVRDPGQTWTLTLTDAKINAWLALRLPAWIENNANMRWPKEIGTPQVLIEPDGLSIAVPVTAKGVTRTVVAKVRPEIEKQVTGDASGGREADTGLASAPAVTEKVDEALSMPLVSVSLGKVWIPGEPLRRVIDSVREAAPEFLNDARVQQAIEVLAGRATIEPVHRLGDGRVVRITEVQLKRGEIALTARTLTDSESAHRSP